MKKINYLSEESIQLDSIVLPNSTYSINRETNELNWTDCPVKSVVNRIDTRHYSVAMSSKMFIPVDLKANCELRKIENGYFKDCYVIVERSNSSKFTTIYVVSENKILRYVNSDKVLSDEQINTLFSNEAIAKVTASVLKEFDVTKPRQACQSYCENLPTQCYFNKNFLKDVVGAVSSTPLKIIGTYNPEIIKVNVCVSMNMSVFKQQLANERQVVSEIEV